MNRDINAVRRFRGASTAFEASSLAFVVSHPSEEA